MNKLKFTSSLFFLFAVNVSIFAQDFYKSGQAASVTLAPTNATEGIIPSLSANGFTAYSPSDSTLFFWEQNPTQTNQTASKTQKMRRLADFSRWRDTAYFATSKGIASVPVGVLGVGQGDFLLGTNFKAQVGNVTFQNIKSICRDDSYFYVADSAKIHIWFNFPNAQFTASLTSLNFSATNHPLSIQTDGSTLTVTLEDGSVVFYKISDLRIGATPFKTITPSANLLKKAVDAITFSNQVFIVDAPRNRVLAWQNIADAGDETKAITLGAKNLTDTLPAQNLEKIANPTALTFDGRHLWVGEKGGRMVCFVLPTSPVNCIKPEPLKNLSPGLLSCGNDKIIRGTTLSWSTSKYKIIVTVEKYPFGTNNTVLADSCFTGNNRDISQITSENGVSNYRWRVQPNANFCGDTNCLGEKSDWYYFNTFPVFNTPPRNRIFSICEKSPEAFLSINDNFKDSSATIYYEWFKNGVLIPDVKGKTYKTNQVGTYKMRKILRGGIGCPEIILEGRDSVVVEQFLDSNILFFTEETKFCIENNIFFKAAGASSYTFSNLTLGTSTDYSNIRPEVLFPHSFILKDTFPNRLRLTASNGLCSTTKEATVKAIKPNVLFEMISKNQICKGDSIVLKVTNGANIRSPFVGFRLSDSIGTLIPLFSGSNSITLSATDKVNGCQEEKRFEFTVSEFPNNFLFFDKPSYCVNDVAVISTTQSQNKVKWVGQNFSSTEGTSNTLKLDKVGTFSFQTIRTNNFGCSATYSHTITAKPGIKVAIANKVDTICPGNNNINLIATGAQYYEWLNSNNQSLSSSSSYPLNFSQTGKIRIILKGTDVGCIGYDTTDIYVRPKIANNTALSISNEGCLSTGIYLKAISPDPSKFTSYWWEVNWQIFQTATPYLIYPYADIRNPVNQAKVSSTLTTPDDKCATSQTVSSESISISCTQPPIYELLKDKKVDIAPNPNNGNFEVKFTLLESANISIQVQNALGQPVFSTTKGSAKGDIREPINLSGQPKGLYFVVVGINEKLFSSKVLVE